MIQKKALAAQHWGAIASDVAAQTKESLAKSDFLQGRSLYVAPVSGAPFDKAFANYMISSLVRAGLPVTPNSDGAVELKYETQVIYHRVEFDPKEKGYIAGAPQSAGSDLWVLRNVDDHNFTGAAAAADVAATPDAEKYRTLPTNTELLITTSIADDDKYVQRSTDAYYIERADAQLFFRSSAFKEWEVKEE
jgi:hypothetical protein